MEESRDIVGDVYSGKLPGESEYERSERERLKRVANTQRHTAATNNTAYVVRRAIANKINKAVHGEEYMPGGLGDILTAQSAYSPDNEGLQTVADVGAELALMAPQAIMDFGVGINDTLDQGIEELGGDLFEDDTLFDKNMIDELGVGSRTIFGRIGLRGLAAPVMLMGAAGSATRGFAMTRAAYTARAAGTAASGAASFSEIGKRALTSNFFSKQAAGMFAMDLVAQGRFDGTLTDMAVDMGALDEDNWWAKAFANNPDDHWALQKLRGAVEGAFAGVLFDGALEGVFYGAHKGLNAIRGNPDAPIDPRRFDILRQDAKRLAEEGKLSPDDAEALVQGKLWERPKFDRSGPVRTQLSEALAGAYGDDAGKMMDVTDRMFATLAVHSGKSLEDVYKKAVAGLTVREDGTIDPNALKQILRSSPVFSGQDRLTVTPSGKGGRVRTLDLQEALQQRQAAVRKYKASDFSPKTMEETAQALSDELAFALEQPLGKQSPDWYNNRVEEMFTTLSAKHPTLGEAGDTPDKYLFKVALAIASQGNNVHQNIEGALSLFEGYKATGKFDPDSAKLSGKNIAAIQANVRKVQNLLDTVGFEEMRKMFRNERTVGEMVRDGIKKPNGEGVNAKLPGSSMLGPKVGLFLANMDGHASGLTMDLWWARTWNRLRGSLVPTKAAKKKAMARQVKQIDEVFAEATPEQLAGVDLAKLKKDEAYRQTVYTKLQKDFEARGFEDGNAVDRWANRMRVLEEGAAAAPRNSKEREAMRTAMKRALEITEQKHGKKVNMAAAQAILWYHEKDLYKRMGAQRIEFDDFADAAGDVINGRTPEEITALRRERTASRTGPRIEFDVRQPTAGAVGGGRRAGSAVPGGAGGSDRLSQGARGQVQFMDDGRAMVTLFKNADPSTSFDKSTFLHEASHIWRRQAAELAPELHDKAAKAFGVVDPNKWTVREEEMFARGFETYLSTGKAPTSDLVGVFAALKDWMTSIYEHLVKSPLTNTLTDSQRDVFDRMLGSDWNRANPLRTKPSTTPPKASKIASTLKDEYTASFPSAPKVRGGEKPQFDQELSKRLADAFDEMQHDPTNPQVVAAYRALATETMSQYEFLKSKGLRMVPDAGKFSYASSQAMIEDLETNRRLYVFKTNNDETTSFGTGSGGELDNPLLAKTGEVIMDSEGKPYEVTVNDVFRFVHDVFGHGADGSTFGPKGEERAWLTHASMFSRDAIPALTTETRGQNSWVNSGKHMRRADGSIPAQGDPDWVHPKDRRFADQKIGLLPPWAWDHPYLDDPGDGPKMVQRIKEAFEEARANGLDEPTAAVYAMRPHINKGRIFEDADVVGLLRDFEPAFGGSRAQHIKNLLTLDDIKVMANDLAMRPKEFISWLEANAKQTDSLAAKIVGLRIMENALARELADSARAVDLKAMQGVPTDEGDLKRVMDALSSFSHVGELRARTQRAAAVAVTSGNIAVGDMDEAKVQGLKDMLAGLNTDNARQYTELANKARQEGDRALADAFARTAETVVDAQLGKIVKTSPKPAKKAKAPKGNAAAAGTTTPTTQPTPGAAPAPAGGPTIAPGASPAQPTPSAPAAPGSPSAPPQPSGGNPAGAAPGTNPALPAPPPAQGLTPAQQARIQRVAQVITAGSKTGQLPKTVQRARNAATYGMLDVFLEHWKASILSGIPTLGINTLSGGIQTFYQPMARMLGSLVEAARGNGLSEVKNSWRLMTGVAHAFKDMAYSVAIAPPAGQKGFRGVRSVLRTIKTEINTLQATTASESMGVIKSDNFGSWAQTPVVKQAIDGWGRLVRVPFVLNQAAEEFWSQLNYQAFIRMKMMDEVDVEVWQNAAVPQAQKPLVAAAALEKKITEAYDDYGRAALDPTDPDKFLHLEAVKYAQSVNFTQEMLGNLGPGLDRLRAKNPWLHLFLPFLKAPVNMLHAAGRHVPFLGLMEEAHMAKHGEVRTADEVLRHRGEMVAAFGITGYATWLAANGLITGGGPENLEEKQVLQATGWRPYSFVIKDEDGTTKYLEFRRFDPFSSIFGIVADASESMAYMRRGETEGVATKAIWSFARNLTSKTYLTGVQELMTLLNNPTGAQATKILSNRAGSLVPAALARYDQAFGDDPTLKETRGVLDGIRRRLPGMSDEVPPRRNLLGEPVTPNAGWLGWNDASGSTADRWGTFMSPVGLSRNVGDKVFNELASLRFGFHPPATTWEGIDLRSVRKNGREAYDVMFERVGKVTIQGKTIHQALEALVNKPVWDTLPDPVNSSDNDNPKVVRVRNIIAAYQRKARIEMLREFPEIKAAAKEMRVASAQGQSTVAVLRRLSEM